MNHIKFANLVGFIVTKLSYRPNEYEIRDLSDLVGDIIATEIEDKRLNINVEHVNALLSAIAECKKIEAIKQYRSLTGLTLLEAKNAVEKYWVPRSEVAA